MTLIALPSTDSIQYTQESSTATALVLAAGAAIMPGLSRLPMLIWIGLNGALALVAALIAAAATREIILARFGKRGGA